MTGSVLPDLVVGVVILGLLVYRQLKVRPVRARARITLILAVLGVSQVASFLSAHHADPLTVTSLAGSLVLAAFFAKVGLPQYACGCATARPGRRAAG